MGLMRKEITLVLVIVAIVAGIAFGQWYEQGNNSTPSNIPKSEMLGYMNNNLNVSVGITLNGEILSLNVSIINDDTAKTHTGVVNLKSPSGKTLLNVEESLKPQQSFFRTYTLNVTGLKNAEVFILIDPQAKIASGISKTIQLSKK
ncbi:hypothetical protein [Thermococcus sp. Bubb.Bath]|uniref:hypothetical protein n=1 Tax=Thermococcus sp. Bubb.Bath TaxID=1638242 RepID=UPI001439F0D6|nr:hypothetical protein [Thermococcus sp. Bubb.Bath]NJF25334.1 hypothetical protein [Thermococcus sp. Bubb.Bath]